MKPSGMCLHIYSLPSSAFLKYQTRGFIVPEANLIPLLTFERMILCKVSLSSSCFSAKYWTGHRYFHKLEYNGRSLVKIKSIPDWHLFISRMETKWTKWYAMASHVIAYRLLELLFSTHTFHFNCFFDDFNCVFMQIHCLSRVLFDENPAMTLQDIKDTKRYGRTHGQRENSIPTANKVCMGYKITLIELAPSPYFFV